MTGLNGKVALVTGAASKRGMGRAVAVRLAKEGADIAILDKYAAPKSIWPGDEDWYGLDAVVKEIEAEGRQGLALVRRSAPLFFLRLSVRRGSDGLRQRRGRRSRRGHLGRIRLRLGERSGDRRRRRDRRLLASAEARAGAERRREQTHPYHSQRRNHGG